MGEVSRAREAVRAAFESGGGHDYGDRTAKALDDHRMAVRNALFGAVSNTLAEHIGKHVGSACAVLTLGDLARDLGRMYVDTLSEED